jgi:hypothetical protein
MTVHLGRWGYRTGNRAYRGKKFEEFLPTARISELLKTTPDLLGGAPLPCLLIYPIRDESVSHRKTSKKTRFSGIIRLIILEPFYEGCLEFRGPNDFASLERLPAFATFDNGLKYVLCRWVLQRGTLEGVGGQL